MAICVECATPVPTLYTVYSRGNISLTQCASCKEFADKYIEFDRVLVFIDMLLHKPQVYRHLLFNRMEKRESKAVVRFAVLLLFFDVFLKWSRLEKTRYPDSHLLFRYLFLVLVCFLETLAFHLSVGFAVKSFADCNFFEISAALVISSFGKLFYALIVIWDYQDLAFAWIVSTIVYTSNAEAISVFLGLNYWKSLSVLCFGLVLKYAVSLALVHLDSALPLSFF